MWKPIWEQLWERHRGKTIGVIGSCLLGLIYLIFGLWKMLIFTLIVYTGYYIGSKLDRNEPVLPTEETWRRLMDKWRLFR